MKKKEMNVEIVNPNAAGIDVGSRSHYVAIGQSHGDVREYGVYASDLTRLIHREVIFLRKSHRTSLRIVWNLI